MFDVSAPESVMVRAWYDGLRLVFDNLLDNAAVHGGSRVRIGVHDDGASVVGDRPTAGRPDEDLPVSAESTSDGGIRVLVRLPVSHPATEPPRI
jgi:signal transduction histidine kinase